MPSRSPLTWSRDGRGWPHAEASRFVESGGLTWHVQVAGTGPAALLLHGTGAANHSWRGLLPKLTDAFTVVAPDLPGHGFTQVPEPRDFTLPGMARQIALLLQTLQLQPVILIGHSAGAALAAHLTLHRLLDPKHVLSINGAILPLQGLPGVVFSPTARFLARNPVIPRLFAWSAIERSAIERLVRSTGSRLDTDGVDLYARLIRNPRHVSSVLSMMASWDLQPLNRELTQLTVPTTLVVGGNDQTLPTGEADRVHRLIPHAHRVRLPGLGHLAHEERPDLVAELLNDRLERDRAGASAAS